MAIPMIQPKKNDDHVLHACMLLHLGLVVQEYHIDPTQAGWLYRVMLLSGDRALCVKVASQPMQLLLALLTLHTVHTLVNRPWPMASRRSNPGACRPRAPSATRPLWIYGHPLPTWQPPL